jgi:hypothetical protein
VSASAVGLALSVTRSRIGIQCLMVMLEAGQIATWETYASQTIPDM